MLLGHGPSRIFYETLRGAIHKYQTSLVALARESAPDAPATTRVLEVALYCPMDIYSDSAKYSVLARSPKPAKCFF